MKLIFREVFQHENKCDSALILLNSEFCIFHVSCMKHRWQQNVYWSELVCRLFIPIPSGGKDVETNFKSCSRRETIMQIVGEQIRFRMVSNRRRIQTNKIEDGNKYKMSIQTNKIEDENKQEVRTDGMLHPASASSGR